MKMRNAIIVSLCLLLVPLSIRSQINRLGKDVQYGASLRGTFGEGDNAPFWFTNNRYGLGALKDNTFLARTYIKRNVEADSLRAWRIGYGADLVAGYGNQCQFSIQQAFVDVQWKMLGLSVGQKERASELKDDELSTGGMTLGINARPLPQVRLELPDFWDVPGTKGWLALKAHIAYGWYTDNKYQRDRNTAKPILYTQNSYFHSKALLIKIGNERRFPLTLKWGLEMACQFGGKGYNVTSYQGDKLEQGVKLGGNFLKAFIPGGSDVNDDIFANAAGNHVGSWHARLDWTGRGWSIGGYMDHLFEDHSQIGMQYGFWKDMLLGLEVNLPRNRYVTSFVYEHLGTMNQSGPIFHDATVENPQQISAKDSYYNHHVYGSWQHAGFIMGNPLIMSPIYNSYLGKHLGANLRGDLHSYFNRVNAHHVGLKGNPTDWLSWRALYTYEKNLGSYDQPVMDPVKGHFLLLEASYRPTQVKGLSITAAYGHNHGSLLGEANGAMLTVAWDGWIRKTK
ncbi:MAG: hypothetical protein IKW91_07620 [Bacteroidaceae bacterium]|nr:hypothetical protein [Bacteroidaceae bacterium]